MTYKDRLDGLKNIARFQSLYCVPIYQSVIDFISRFCMTYDPRLSKDKTIPFILFPKQEEMIKFIYERYKKREQGVVDKCRDVGATWCFCAFAVWLLLFQKESSVGFYSYKADVVDKKGDISTLFGKVRFILENLPNTFTQNIESSYMIVSNNNIGSTIVGASGEQPRGDRRSIIFKDESAFYEHAELVEAALGESSDCIIDISTHAGTNTVFYNKITSGTIPVFTLDWWENPNHSQEWFDKKKEQAMSQGLMHIFAREILRDPSASIENVVIQSEWVKSAIKNELKINGKRIAGLDVADEGSDTKALTIMDGNELIYIDEWSTGDVGECADKAFWKAVEYECEEFRYDNIGVGAGVKARIREIQETLKNKEVKDKKDIIALNMKVKGWSAAGKVIRPEECDYDDKPNKLLFENAKSQQYWKVRIEFLETNRYVNEKPCDMGKVLSFGKLENSYIINKLTKEISQPVHTLSASGKIIIKKMPNGSKSPNLLESFIIARAEVEEEWLKFSYI